MPMAFVEGFPHLLKQDSGFRLAAQTPPEQLKFESGRACHSDQLHTHPPFSRLAIAPEPPLAQELVVLQSEQ